MTTAVGPWRWADAAGAMSEVTAAVRTLQEWGVVTGVDYQHLLDTNPAAPAARACRECGCTDNDCSQCIQRTGQPCSWIEADLCSACETRLT